MFTIGDPNIPMEDLLKLVNTEQITDLMNKKFKFIRIPLMLFVCMNTFFNCVDIKINIEQGLYINIAYQTLYSIICFKLCHMTFDKQLK